MSDSDKTPRTASPKKWALIGTTALTGLGLALGSSGQPAHADGAAPMLLAQATISGEAGEAGEGAIETDDSGVEFLVHLGLFDAAIRIVGTLYALGEVAEAKDQLETSHHADYADLEEGLAEFSQNGFIDEYTEFSDLVLSGADAAAVAAAESRLLAAIRATHGADGLSTRDAFEAMVHLIETAAADFEAGVDAGRVAEPHEYRDAWGFVETVRATASDLAASKDATVARAAADVLAALEPAAALFPALNAQTVGSDASILYAAAGRIRFTILKVE
ncbi:MAG: hypothetical protein K8F59_09345 [Rhodobacteraceae bacterium]|nr:hypothetical protein [Paracoccaceae bacterium]